MANPIHILLIDDEKEYCNTLITNARYFGILIKDFQNLEDGFKELEKELKYKAIIFDAKCMVNEKEEVDNFGFLPIALDRLKDFENKYKIHIPFVINTGYSDQKEISMISKQIALKKGKIFDKGSAKEELFNYLIDEINKADITKLEKEYADVFLVFEKGYLPNNMRGDILKILQNNTNPDPAKIKDNLATIRRILDEILSRISSNKPIVLPASKNSFNKKVKHLSGNVKESPIGSGNYLSTTKKYQSSTIEFLSTAIYRISSDFGSHAIPKDTALYQPFPTIYSVQALTFSIFEIILWYIELLKFRTS